jgi:hypothetical protein
MEVSPDKKLKIEDECKFKTLSIEDINKLYLEIRKKSKKGKIGLMCSTFDITEISYEKEDEESEALGVKIYVIF